MTHLYLGEATGVDGDNAGKYDPATGEMSVNTYPIESQTVTIPVRVNEAERICRKNYGGDEQAPRTVYL